MSNRERWIVYPLLLFTIVSIVFDRIRDRSFVHFDTVHCGELIVASPQGSPRIVLQNSPATASGLITIHGPTVGTNDQARVHLNDVQAEIGADDSGGFVRIVGAEGVPTLVLGHAGERELSGLVATDQHGALLTAATKDGETTDAWGSTLSWEQVPNSHRDFRNATANLRSNENASQTAASGESDPPERQTAD